MEAALKLVVDAAFGHLAEGEAEVLAGDVGVGGAGVERLLEHEVQVGGLGEFGRAAEAAVGAVAVLEQLARGSAPNRAGGFRGLLGGQLDTHVEVLGELLGLLLDLRALLLPGARNAAQHIGPAGHPGASLRRKVGAAEERAAVGRAEHVERPAAVTLQQLHGVHVDVVDIGPFLAVDLDADDEVVLELRDLLVLERFALHHVAPVAGGVADGDEHRFVFSAGLGPGVVAPGEPVDGVVRVLQQVGRCLLGEAVGVVWRHRRSVDLVLANSR